MMSLEGWFLSHEIQLRASIFFSMLITMAALEIVIPKQPLSLTRKQRWPANLSLVVLNSLVLRLIFPMAAAGVAVYCSEQNIGLFNQVSAPLLITTVFTIVLMDLLIYLQHVLVHKIPLFWRFHKVHHADLNYDVTTGSRFHPVEIIFSMLLKIAFIMAIGAPAIAVILFEIILNAMAMFNHSNIKINKRLDKLLRIILVTPDMHRVHHSSNPTETDSNFGFNLSIWDKCFKTYTIKPSKGYQGMEIGLKEYRDPLRTQKLLSMLTLPFK